MTEYGYVRVSHTDQNEVRQVIAMHENGLEDQNIYIDKKSGKDFNRPQYQMLYKKLSKGDVLYVLSLDRLGRNYVDIQEQWYLTTKKKKADIVIIDMPLLDTRREKNLMGQVISDVVLQLLAFFAQTERENIKERQKQGIAAAKARGVQFGRPKLILPDNFMEIYEDWKKHRISPKEAAELSNMSLTAFYTHARKLLASEGLTVKSRGGPPQPQKTDSYITFRTIERKELFQQTFDEWLSQSITTVEAARRLNVSQDYFLRSASKLQSGTQLRVAKHTRRKTEYVILRSEERIELYREVYDEWNRKKISAKEAARRLGITREAFLRNAGKLQAGYKFKVEKKTKRYG